MLMHLRGGDYGLGPRIGLLAAGWAGGYPGTVGGVGGVMSLHGGVDLLGDDWSAAPAGA